MNTRKETSAIQKAPNNISAMVKALQKKYPTRYNNLSKNYRYFTTGTGFVIDYCFYLEHETPQLNLTWSELKAIVEVYLNK